MIRFFSNTKVRKNATCTFFTHSIQVRGIDKMLAYKLRVIFVISSVIGRHFLAVQYLE